ncbi:MAG: HYR domain-containing protein [Bacteroidia bacterium]
MLLLLAMLPWALPAQLTVTCPPNAVIGTDPGICGAVYNYSLIVTGASTTNDTFNYTGGPQTFTVPNGVGSVTIQAWGAQGNTSGFSVVGGLGGYATGTLAVTPGQVLNLYVGGGAIASTTGGYNGGGNAGAVGCPQAFGGGGGGASDVRVGGTALTDRVIVAAGGGGAAGNRVSACGRGTGGGGGGGYYGGGGGAGWPYTSTIVPTGGTQSAGGIGGTSTWTSVTNNNGFPGVLGIGGNGGEEAASNQAGAATATSGGIGGGLTGAAGTYAGNFTGQSGAGGSSYIGGVTGGSTTAGLRTGAGRIVISYQMVDSVYATSGGLSGSTFGTGVTTNTIVVSDNGNTSSCTFTVTVSDDDAPTMTCPTFDTLAITSNCAAALPNYSPIIPSTDNCTAVPVESQFPAAGTMMSGLGNSYPVTFYASDSVGNQDSCTFVVFLWDFDAPTVNCPNVSITPTTLDCSPVVTYPDPTATDNCGIASTFSSANSGDVFPLGATPVTYIAMDSAGNADTCTFMVTVNNPILNGFVTIAPNAVCLGDSFILTATPGYSYAWSTGSTAQIVGAFVSGAMWVDITDSGCTGRDSVIVPAFNDPQPQVTPNGASLCTSTFSSYQWYMNGVAIPGATNQCYQPTTDGTFSVVVTDGIGCEGESDTTFFVGVTPGFGTIGFDLYPNPATSSVNLTVAQPLLDRGSITIMDLAGRVVRSQSFNQLSGTVNLDLSQMAQGSYIVRVSSGTSEGQRKLMHIE